MGRNEARSTAGSSAFPNLKECKSPAERIHPRNLGSSPVSNQASVALWAKLKPPPVPPDPKASAPNCKKVKCCPTSIRRWTTKAEKLPNTIVPIHIKVVTPQG